MPQQPEQYRTDRKCVLVVDDEDTIRNFVSGLLIRSGFDVITAGTGEQALSLSKDHKGRIDLLISNIQMPGITGLELAAKVTAERAEIKVMLMSGFDAGMLILNEGWHFLHKPFIPSQLMGIIRTVLGQSSAPNMDEHKP